MSAAEPGVAFERCVARLDYPMVVVTVATRTERAGCLVGFSTQCSIDPARYAVCISKNNHTADVAARCETMIVHVLGPDHTTLAELFGETTGDTFSKFDAHPWSPGPGGVPVLAGCDWFAGRVASRIDVGDHVLYVLDVTHDGWSGATDAGQLGFQQVKRLTPGHAP